MEEGGGPTGEETAKCCGRAYVAVWRTHIWEGIMYFTVWKIHKWRKWTFFYVHYLSDFYPSVLVFLKNWMHFKQYLYLKVSEKFVFQKIYLIWVTF